MKDSLFVQMFCCVL